MTASPAARPAAKPAQRRRVWPAWRIWPARRAWRITGAVVLVGLTTLAAAEWAGWPFLRQPLAQQFSRIAGVAVTIDAPFRIRLLGTPTLTASRLTVAAAAGTSAPFLMDATGVTMSLRWADMVGAARGQGVRVSQLLADTLRAHLSRSADGRASWQIGAKPNATPATPASSAPRPVVDVLVVRQADVRVDDQALLLRLDVHVAEVAASGAASGSAAMSPVRITAQGQFRQAQVRAKFDIDHMLSLFTPVGSSQPMAQLSGYAHVGRATLNFAGQLGGLAQVPAVQGELTATGPSLGLVMKPLGLSLPQTPPFVLHGKIAVSGPVWQLAADRIDIGSSRLAGQFNFDTKKQPAYLSGQLTGALLALKDLGPSVGAQAPVAERGRVLPDKVLDIPALNAMDADVGVAIHSLDFGTTTVAPLHALKMQVSLRDGLLKLDKLSAQVAGGTVRGSSSLQAKGAQARWQAALQFEGIAVSQWLRSLQKSAPQPGPTASADRAVPLATGALNARVSLTGQGRSVAEVLGSADGQVQARLTDGSLSHLVTEVAGLDVGQALGVFIRGDRALALRCARLQARVNKGVVGPVQGLLDNSDSVLRIDGQVNLRSEAMDLRLVVRPKDFSPLSLRSPVHVRGTLSQARLSVEPGPIAARLLGALALGAVAPVLAWIPLLDASGTEAQDACTQPLTAEGDKQKVKTAPSTARRTPRQSLSARSYSHAG
jgi:AsmA family protein